MQEVPQGHKPGMREEVKDEGGDLLSNKLTAHVETLTLCYFRVISLSVKGVHQSLLYSRAFP